MSEENYVCDYLQRQIEQGGGGLLKLTSRDRLSGQDAASRSLEVQDLYLEQSEGKARDQEPDTVTLFETRGGRTTRLVTVVRDVTPLPERRQVFSQIDLDAVADGKIPIRFGCTGEQAISGRSVVHLASESVSREHFKLSLSNGIWTATDLGSRSGTVVGGRRLQNVRSRSRLGPSIQSRRSFRSSRLFGDLSDHATAVVWSEIGNSSSPLIHPYRGQATAIEDGSVDDSAIFSFMQSSFTSTPSAYSFSFADNTDGQRKSAPAVWDRVTLKPGHVTTIEAGDCTLYVSVPLPRVWRQSPLPEYDLLEGLFRRSLNDYYRLDGAWKDVKGRAALAKRHATLCELQKISKKDAEQWERYHRDQMMAKIPHLQQILAVFEEEAVMVTRACPGAVPLKAYLLQKGEGRCDTGTVLRLLRDALEALAALAEWGMSLPGGVRPACVAVNQQGQQSQIILRIVGNAAIVPPDRRDAAQARDVTQMLRLFHNYKLRDRDDVWQDLLTTEFRTAQEALAAMPRMGYAFGSITVRPITSGDGDGARKRPSRRGPALRSEVERTRQLIESLEKSGMEGNAYGGGGGSYSVSMLARLLKTRAVLMLSEVAGLRMVTMWRGGAGAQVPLLRWQGWKLLNCSVLLSLTPAILGADFLQKYGDLDWVWVISDDEELHGLYVDMGSGGRQIAEELGLKLIIEEEEEEEEEEGQGQSRNVSPELEGNDDDDDDLEETDITQSGQQKRRRPPRNIYHCNYTRTLPWTIRDGRHRWHHENTKVDLKTIEEELKLGEQLAQEKRELSLYYYRDQLDKMVTAIRLQEKKYEDNGKGRRGKEKEEKEDKSDNDHDHDHDYDDHDDHDQQEINTVKRSKRKASSSSEKSADLKFRFRSLKSQSSQEKAEREAWRRKMRTDRDKERKADDQQRERRRKQEDKAEEMALHEPCYQVTSSPVTLE